MTGPPLNGAAYNGIGFNLSSPTEVDISRQQAIQLQLPAAIYEFGERSLSNETAIYNTNAVVDITERVYVSRRFVCDSNPCSDMRHAEDIPGAACSNSILFTQDGIHDDACDDRHQTFVD